MNVKVTIYDDRFLNDVPPVTMIFDADEVSHSGLPDFVLEDPMDYSPYKILSGYLEKDWREKTPIENGFRHELALTRNNITTRYLLQSVEVFITNESGKTVDMFKTFK